MQAMSKWVLALACSAPAFAATAQTVSYDFTATVTSSSGLLYGLITPGSTIKGTYTIDLSAANPADSIDLGSATAEGIAAAAGGTSVGTLAPQAPVFASTASAGALKFSSGTQAAYFSSSGVQTTPPGANGLETYSAGELNEYGGGVSSASYFSLEGLNLFASDGLLSLGGAIGKDVGGFEETGFGSKNSVTYAIRSLSVVPTAAPEIDAGGITTGASLLIGGLVVVRGRRRDEAPGRA